MTALWVKIGGITHAAAVSAAMDAGADAIGFVFAPSVRCVTPQQAAQLADPARGRLTCVAVTRHPSSELLQEIFRVFAPDILQTDIDDLTSIALPARCAALPVLRARSASTQRRPVRVLFEGARSGTGEIADWRSAAALARECELVLAGGLHAGNVAAAVAEVMPYGVDVSSGVETAPGRKSPQKILEFVRAARAAAREGVR